MKTILTALVALFVFGLTPPATAGTLSAGAESESHAAPAVVTASYEAIAQCLTEAGLIEGVHFRQVPDWNQPGAGYGKVQIRRSVIMTEAIKDCALGEPLF